MPPVLQLQLKRYVFLSVALCVFVLILLSLSLSSFEYDPMKDCNVKVNDRYEFPPVIDLARFLNPDAAKTLGTPQMNDNALKESRKGSKILQGVNGTASGKPPSSVYHLFGYDRRE